MVGFHLRVAAVPPCRALAVFRAGSASEKSLLPASRLSNMDSILNWTAAALTVLVLVYYELSLLIRERRQPETLARTIHAKLREDWFAAISQQPGTEVLAVQTLRNSLMSATMTASTAALALMGTVTLAIPTLRASFGETGFTAHLALELALIALLFASLICSVMAARYYNHAGFIGGMPVESEGRKRWNASGVAYVRKAGLLYSWGLRHLVLVAPILAFLLQPLAGVPAALVVTWLLGRFDRVRFVGQGEAEIAP